MSAAQQQRREPQSSEAHEQQPPPGLSMLDGAVLIHILASCPDPHALACTCTTLAAASATSLCRGQWFGRWWPAHPVACARPLVLAALSWRGARCGPDAPSTAALVQLLRGTLRLCGGSRCGPLPPTAELHTSPAPDAGLQLLQQLTPWSEHLLLPAAAGSGHTELLRQLLADGAAASAAARAAGAAQGRMGRQRCWLQRRLPSELGLQDCQHDVLQSGMLAAARGGARGCLAVLVQQLLASPRPPLVQLDLLLASAEAAAAGGHLACFQFITQGVLGTACAPHHQQGGGDSCGAEPEELGRGWHEALAKLGQQLAPPLQEVQPPGRLAWLASRGSSYLLVAASASGSCAVLDTVLQQLQPRAVKQQLPAALAAAGQRGHLAVLQQLLALPDTSARPLQLAALDAALDGWPAATLAALLAHAASAHRLELLQLLAKPLVASLQQQRQQKPEAAAAADEFLDTLVEHASIEHPELLADPLLLLANQGRAERVAWVLRVAPTVLVKLGERAAAAALEGGHPRLAQAILDAGGERPAAFKAAAKRGQLTAAVAAADVSETERLLHEVSLPLVWSCEATAVGGAGGAVCRASGSGGGAAAAAPGPAAAGGNGHALPLLPYHGPLHAAPGAPAAAAAAAAAANGHDGGAAALLDLLQLDAQQQQQQHEADGHNHQWAAQQQLPGGSAAPTRCLQTLLKTAALAQPPVSTRLLRLLLPALPAQGSPSKQQVLLVLAKCCIDAGRVQELQAVLESQGRSPSRQRREFVASLVAYLQLPHRQAVMAGGAGHVSSGSSSSAAAPAAANEPAIAAVLALMEEHGFGSMLAAAVTHSYLSVSQPGEYLGGLARPLMPAAHIPCLRQIAQLMWALGNAPALPRGAVVRDGTDSLLRLMVRAVLQAGDVDVLHAFLRLMQRHGPALVAGAQDGGEQLWRGMGPDDELDEEHADEG